MRMDAKFSGDILMVYVSCSF